MVTSFQSPRVDVEALLVEVADVLNTTLDLDTLLQRVAEVVKRVIDYEIFSILLLNQRSQELRFRFQIGHLPEVAERIRVKVGEGVTGRAVQERRAVLVDDVSKETHYIEALPRVRSELAVPLITKNKVIGVIDLEAREPSYFKEEHARLLGLIASRIAVSIENARLYTRVSRQANTLELLTEISRELTSILNVDQLLQRVADLVLKLIDYQMFSILLLDESKQKLVHRFSVRFKENIHLKHDIPLGRGLVGAAALEKRAILVPDVRKDPRYINVNAETRSELCVPLIYKDNVIGVLDLEHTRRGYFQEDHTRAMSTLAAQIAIAIENATLYERLAREEQRLERDLAMAREVQHHLLPPSCPNLPGAELAARYNPAHAIGGDMYDFLDYKPPRACITVGDVSGKGAPAALYAALVSGIIRSLSPQEPSPAQMLSGVNRALTQRRLDANYVVLCCAVWDDDKKIMRVANSGLPRPIHCRQGHAHMIEATGLPPGMFGDATYDEITIHAARGDVFVFLSDGIIDASNAHDEQFGRSRVEHVISKSADGSAQQIVDAIFDATDQFSAGVEVFDDQTVVVLKVKP
ncbi:MAG TPA: GAF domain-containing SpoIIE family protein phosphatase [Candidatus Angelobacter sp.]|nr:GAF domain-containing SpoIIE family protein phosphatase [Candidatus Angelobacter sp.]